MQFKVTIILHSDHHTWLNPLSFEIFISCISLIYPAFIHKHFVSNNSRIKDGIYIYFFHQLNSFNRLFLPKKRSFLGFLWVQLFVDIPLAYPVVYRVFIFFLKVCICISYLYHHLVVLLYLQLII